MIHSKIKESYSYEAGYITLLHYGYITHLPSQAHPPISLTFPSGAKEIHQQFEREIMKTVLLHWCFNK
jgi:hypothetical protein